MQATHRKARLLPSCNQRDTFAGNRNRMTSTKRLALLKSDRAALAPGSAGEEI
jgi:hypothetical protein